MELKQLQHFVVSVDTGSLSRAAEVLFTTQPHISKTVKLLEQELGMELLERTPTGVFVTEPGKKVYEYARRMLAAEQKIAMLRQEDNRCQLSLTSMPSSELAQLFALYWKAHDTLTARVQEGALESVLHQVSHHQVTLGFLFVSDFQLQALKNMLRHKRLEFCPLKRVQLVLYAGPENPYYACESVDWAKLKKLRYVQNREEDISLFGYVGHMRDNLFDPRQVRIAAEVSSDHVLLQLLRHTALGSIGCRLCGQTELADGVRAIRIEGGDSVQFGYAKRLNHTLTGPENDFLAYLRSSLV